jgi:hypothetical protein
MRALVGSAPGRICLVAAIACEVLAAVWMRHVLRESAPWS